MVKKIISDQWFNEFCSQCPKYFSLSYFDPDSLKPSKSHIIVVQSGTHNYLNFKSTVMLLLLAGIYCLVMLKATFNRNVSPLCQMSDMDVMEDIPHFILSFPYLDGTHNFETILWSYTNHLANKIVYLGFSVLAL